MPEGNKTIIDASARFNARRSLAEIDAGTNEFELMRSSLEHQPHAYASYVRGTYPHLVELVQSRIDTGMKTFIDPDECDGQCCTMSSVYQERTTQGVESRLNVPVSMVKELSEHLKPLFFDPLFSARTAESPKARQNLLASSGVMAAWMGLANWTFDKLDPRINEPYAHGTPAHMQMALLAGYSNDEYFEKKMQGAMEKRIGDNILILKLRFMGHMAYKGLSNYESQTRYEGLANEYEVEMFKKMFGREFVSSSQIDPGSITDVSFALAHPLEESEVTETIQLMRSV